MQQTQKKEGIDSIFLDPPRRTRRPIELFLIPGDDIFTVTDHKIMREVGLSGWAVQQDISRWEDAPLDWGNLPSILRGAVLTDAIESLEMQIRYALPFRHLGRVFTFALLPATEDRAIRVRRQQSQLPAPQSQSQLPDEDFHRRIMRDPPVPFLTLGLASPDVAVQHAAAVREMLVNQNNRSIHAGLSDILLDLARVGQITKSEAFYYLVGMRALASGSWRQLRENFGLMAVEYLITHSTSQNPIQAQLLAEAHLIDGQPIEWEEGDPLDVELAAGS